MECKCEEYKKLLADVVNELDLSETAREMHEQRGTTPAGLVRIVLAGKNRLITRLINSLINQKD